MKSYEGQSQLTHDSVSGLSLYIMEMWSFDTSNLGVSQAQAARSRIHYQS